MAAVHARALPPGWSVASIAGLLETPGARALVTAGGFVIVRTAADEAEILTIAINEEQRRRGAGRALLEAAMDVARTAGAATLHLEVASSNEGARKFYERAGFLETGRRARYYPDGADALLLSRTLA